MAATTPYVVITRNGFPARTAQELVAQLRERMLVAALDPWEADNSAEASRNFFTAEQTTWREYVNRTNLRLDE